MKRILELDGLRGLAALSVILFHLTPKHVPYGGSAVDCFFVLSGFLITGILLRNKEEPRLLVNFYARRSLRIWPIYYLTLLGLLALNKITRQNYPTDGFFNYLTYTQLIQVYWNGRIPPFIPSYHHTWTLAMEEQYYLLWPILVAFMGRRGLIVSAVGFITTCILCRSFGLYPKLLFSRGDGFAYGSLLAVWLTTQRNTYNYKRNLFIFISLVVILGTALIVFTKYPSKIPLPWGAIELDGSRESIALLYAPFYFALIGAVVISQGHPFLGFLRLPIATYIGQISYGLYLYHIPVMHGIEGAFRKIFHYKTGFDASRPLSRTLLDLIVTFLAACLSWYLVEKPILSLKDRFRYSSRRISTRQISRDANIQTGGFSRH